MKTKLLAVLIVGVMMVFTACGSSNKTDTTAPGQTAIASSTATAGSGSIAYPITGAEGVTLTYWMPTNANATKYVENYSDTEVWQEVMKRTGVKVEFIHPATGQEKEQFNIMMASGDLPDIINGADWYSGGELNGFNEGAYLDLTELVKTYAPDYYREANADTERTREFYSENGIMSAFYRINVNAVPQVERPLIRPDWLQEFGMEDPVTLEQFETYMKKVKEIKNVSPFIPIIGDAKQKTQQEPWYGAFDMLPDWYVKDGVVKYGNAEPELKNLLTWLADMYIKGYISKDFPTMDMKQIMADFNSGNTGMYVNSVDNGRSSAIAAGVPIASTKLPRVTIDQKIHTGIQGWPKGGDVTAITTACKNPQIAAQFLNYAFTKDGAMLYNYGIEGKTYTMVDGEPKYTDYMLNNPLYPTESANYILRIHFAAKLQTETPLKFNPTIAKSPEAVEFRLKWTDDPNVDNAYRLPPITLSQADSSERGKIMTNLNTYADEMILRFIMGAEPLSNFDKYMDKIKGYGIDRAKEITQRAYDNYMSR